MKIGLASTLFFAILITLFANGALSQTVNVTVSCQKCRIVCGVTNCYRIAAPGYERQTCPTTSCDLTSTPPVATIEPCTNDIFGNSCSNGQCYSTYGYQNKQLQCANLMWGVSNCTKSYASTFTCQICPDNVATVTASRCPSRLCLVQNSTYTDNSGTRGPLYTCLSTSNTSCAQYLASNANYFLNFATTSNRADVAFIGCTKRDLSNNICSCCYNYTNINTTNPTVAARRTRICSTNYPLFTDSSFQLYYTNMSSSFGRSIAYGNVALQFEKFSFLTLASILVVFMALLF